ncbi:hypothetical protein J6590_039568 [Homalodisca vitripennis]|nr:hypothetical protein J6590_039568 [Homalodisca vitripennis]
MVAQSAPGSSKNCFRSLETEDAELENGDHRFPYEAALVKCMIETSTVKGFCKPSADLLAIVITAEPPTGDCCVLWLVPLCGCGWYQYRTVRPKPVLAGQTYC